QTVDAPRELEAADVLVRPALAARDLARAPDDGHVEARVVRDEHVRSAEVREVGQLLDPGLRADDVFCAEPVDAGVQLEELVVRKGRLYQPALGLDDLAVAHPREAHRARRRTAGVRRLEVDRGEVQWHGFSIARASDVVRQARRAT